MNLDKIEARVNAATPGPWHHDRVRNLIISPLPGGSWMCQSGATPEDREFIAHARADVPALIAEVRRLRDVEAELTEKCSKYSRELDDSDEENERLRKEDAYQADLALEGELLALQAEVRRLRQALLEYGRHNEGCIGAHGDEYPCACGWRDERWREETHDVP